MKHWTAEEIDDKLSRLGLGSVELSAQPVVKIIRDLLAEREAAPVPLYRLPDWLGGHPVHLDRDSPEGVRVWVTDHESTPIAISRDKLVEIKPPSIDDPEPLPLNIRAMAGGLDADIVLSTVYPDGAQLKIDDGDAAIHANLTANGLRRLARAAWQRANAIESGS